MPASFTSFYFLCFYTFILLIYYLIPRKTQWVFLLFASAAFYLLTGNGLLILYPAAACLTAYGAVRVMAGTEDVKKRRWALAAALLLLIGALVVLKYINFGIYTINAAAFLCGAQGEMIGVFDFLVPLGISFYTFSILGYIVDVYNGIAKPQKNFFKTALYGMYFPSILSGPILRYREDGEQFFEPHPFDYRQVTFGLQRMVWGFFKTLVISERMNIVVNTVYDNYTAYPGSYIWIATICFAFQLYTNFSGSMDIVFMELGKKLRKKFGKKRGKQLTTFLAMLILWFTVGIWHGGDWKFVIGSGLLHWFYIVSGELLAPFFRKCMEKLSIDAKSKWVDGFRVLRTFFLVNIGFVFFRAASTTDACRMLASAVGVWNVGDLLRGGIFTLGLDVIETVIAIVSLLLLLAVSLLHQKGSVRARIEKKPVLFRFALWYALLFYIILLGHYGPDYSAAEFIYQGF